MKSPKPVLLFVYGTLIRGHLNHMAYGFDKLKLVDNDSIQGGTLYSVGAYPVLMGHGDNIIPGEVYEVPVEKLFYVGSMEASAGYKTMEAKTLKGHKVLVFVGDMNRCKYNDHYDEKKEEWVELPGTPYWNIDEMPIIKTWTLEMERGGAL